MVKLYEKENQAWLAGAHVERDLWFRLTTRSTPAENATWVHGEERAS